MRCTVVHPAPVALTRGTHQPHLVHTPPPPGPLCGEAHMETWGPCASELLPQLARSSTSSPARSLPGAQLLPGPALLLTLLPWGQESASILCKGPEGEHSRLRTCTSSAPPPRARGQPQRQVSSDHDHVLERLQPQAPKLEFHRLFMCHDMFL